MRIELISISDFEPLPGKDAAKQVVIDLLAMNKSPCGFVTFHGHYGTGKTLLLKASVNGFLNIGLVARYTTLADLLADARERFGNSIGSVEATIDHLRGLHILAIDEIERVNLTGWANETIHRLLDSRYNQRNELLTVLATNLAPGMLPSEFGYLASRMSGGHVVEVGGADLRPAVAIRERKDID